MKKKIVLFLIMTKQVLLLKHVWVYNYIQLVGIYVAALSLTRKV